MLPCPKVLGDDDVGPRPHAGGYGAGDPQDRSGDADSAQSLGADKVAHYDGIRDGIGHLEQLGAHHGQREEQELPPLPSLCHVANRGSPPSL